MNKLLFRIRGFHSCRQKGFTILELLVVLAILGMLAGIIVPNVSGFVNTGNLSAANTEVQYVKTASRGYMADHSSDWPADSDALVTYLSALPETKYTFNTETGLITGVGGIVGNTADASAWPELTFHFDNQQWQTD